MNATISQPFHKILFVCLGNICRSPAAEGIFKSLAESGKEGEQKARNRSFVVDSAGTSAHHRGELPDSRMRAAASQRGFVLNSHSRPFESERDFVNFDLIIAMDRSNQETLLAWAPHPSAAAKVRLMCDWCTAEKPPRSEVPDPYYGGADGFEQVLDLLEDACGGLLRELRRS